MINYNGIIIPNNDLLSFSNRGLNYGDAVFETIKGVTNKLLFFEDHYFRLMASMRILRMEIPMTFTLEFLQLEIQKLLEKKQLSNCAVRIKILVFRNEGGLYNPESNDVSYIISAKKIASDNYTIHKEKYCVDLYKDNFISPSLLSSLKTTNKIINVLASIYAKENDFDNCLLLNTNKQIVEAINGNLFLVNGNIIKTPPISDGCLNGIFRQQLIKLLQKESDYKLQETSISPFELQKADELFITNVISGILPITNYRKKAYTTIVSEQLLAKVNSL